MKKLLTILSFSLLALVINAQPFFWSHDVNGQSPTGNLFASRIEATYIRERISLISNSGFRILEIGIVMRQGTTIPTLENYHDIRYSTLTDVGNETLTFYDLTPSTLYGFRIFVIRGDGTYYLDYDQETTDPDTGTNPPTVVTNTTTDISFETATGNGNVTNEGSASVTERGHVWNTTGNPTISDNKVTSGSGTGSYSTPLTGLPCGIIYVAAYATNIYDTSYGDDELIVTNGDDLSPYFLTFQVICDGDTIDITDLTSAELACDNYYSCSSVSILNQGYSIDGTFQVGTQLYESGTCNKSTISTYFIKAGTPPPLINRIEVVNGIVQSIVQCNP